MAAIVWSDVVGIAPELSSVPPLAQAEILGVVNGTLNAAAFGGESARSYRLARIFLAAHYGSVVSAGGSGPGGPVSSESVGGVSRSYAVFSPMGSDPTLDKTPYGQQYRSLVRASPARAWVVL